MERKEPALISLLARLFIKPDPAREEPETRRAYGVLCGIVGICLNVLLFAGKFLAGTLSGSIAITADAFNNLSDAGSSFVTLVGFQLAGQKPDSEHPFGHGRMEYVSGLAVSVLILLMGLELGKTSIEKILHPEPVDSSPLIFAILCASILVKLYMFLYNRAAGEEAGLSRHGGHRHGLPQRQCGHRRGADRHAGGPFHGPGDRRAGAACWWRPLFSGPASMRCGTRWTPCWARRPPMSSSSASGIW